MIRKYNPKGLGRGVWGCLLLLNGCAGTPAQRFTQRAVELGLTSGQVQGQGFNLRIFRNFQLDTPLRCLHVYLDGDGTPWLGRGRPALDPTPRNPLVLELMALDPVPALYLGRPCYAGQGTASGCTPWLWTHGRYSEAVRASLTAALDGLSRHLDIQDLVLIGYSGGGTLAMLLAPRLPRVRLVATLAANLDVAAWTRLHNYSPLQGSLDPARQPPLPTHIRQLHWVGERDHNTPSNMIRGALAGQSAAHIETLPGVDHRHGWLARWPHLLREIATSRPCPHSGQKGRTPVNLPAPS